MEKERVVGMHPPHPKQLKSQGHRPSIEGDEEEEPLDLDYSYSHLDEFLRSQRGAGSLVAPTSAVSANIHASIPSKNPLSVGSAAVTTT